MTDSKEVRHIVAFIGEDQKEHIGQPNADDGFADEIEGSIFGPHYVLTGKKLKVVSMLPPVHPAAILCIGLNYKKHAKETNMAVPKHPVLFMKNPASINGPFSPIVIPAVSKSKPQIDFEGELAVVIGKWCKNVEEKDALSYVLGYCTANDVSGGQWNRGKGFDTFCPLGPHLVLAKHIPDPNNLRITTHLNDVKVQDSNTSDMIFGVAKIISFLSQDTTLLPGTVILTGTPEGVGLARSPQLWMKHGDQVSVTIEKIGKISNRVQDA